MVEGSLERMPAAGPKYHVERALRKCPRDDSWKRRACQRLKIFWDGDVVISRLWILYWKSHFQEELLVKISIMSNNSDTFKIH